MIIILAQSLMLVTIVFGVMTTQMRLFWLQVPRIHGAGLHDRSALLLIPSAENLVRGGAWTMLVRASARQPLRGLRGLRIVFRSRVLAGRGISRRAGGTEGISQDW